MPMPALARFSHWPERTLVQESLWDVQSLQPDSWTTTSSSRGAGRSGTKKIETSRNGFHGLNILLTQTIRQTRGWSLPGTLRSVWTVESAKVNQVITSRPTASRVRHSNCINNHLVPRSRCLLQPAAAQQAPSWAKGASRVHPPAPNCCGTPKPQKDMSTQSWRPVPSGYHSCSCLTICLPGPGPWQTQESFGSTQAACSHPDLSCLNGLFEDSGLS